MRICLYGAGSTQIKSKYTEESYKLGEEIAKEDILLYLVEDLQESWVLYPKEQ